MLATVNIEMNFTAVTEKLSLCWPVWKFPAGSTVAVELPFKSKKRGVCGMPKTGFFPMYLPNNNQEWQLHNSSTLTYMVVD